MKKAERAQTKSKMNKGEKVMSSQAVKEYLKGRIDHLEKWIKMSHDYKQYAVVRGAEAQVVEYKMIIELLDKE